MRVEWSGTDATVRLNMQRYGDAVINSLYRLGQYFAPTMEAYAKTNRPWMDRTGNARAGLRSYVIREDKRVIIVLTHSVHYGVYLELANAGRYAIILPTLQAHYSMIAASLRGIFRR